jgi:hypothetical protein
MTPLMRYFQEVELPQLGNDGRWICKKLVSELEASLLRHASARTDEVHTFCIKRPETDRVGRQQPAVAPDLAFQETTATMRILSEIATELEGELSWAAYLLIPKEQTVPLDRADGRSHAGRDRYHFVVQGTPGSAMRCGPESMIMPEGSLWWINSRARSEVSNPSGGSQIHLVFELLPTPFLLM